MKIVLPRKQKIAMGACIRLYFIHVSWLLLLLTLCLHVDTSHVHSNISTPDTNNYYYNISNDGSEAHEHGQHRARWRDEMTVRLGRDGLRQLRIAFQGVLVLETSRLPPVHPSEFSSPFPGPHNHTRPHGYVRLVQVTDGRQLVQSVVQDEDSLRDCKTSVDSEDVLNFIHQYFHSAPRRPRSGDVLAAYRNAPSSGRSLSTVQDSNRWRHRRGWRRRGRRRRNPLLRGVLRPLGERRGLGQFASYLHVSEQARRCRKLLSQVRQRLGPSDSDVGRTDTAPTGSGHGQLSGQSHGRHSNGHSSRHRRKRDLMTGWFIFPGTKWCGAGDIAEHNSDLGFDEALDSCCRDHDLCPHIIPRVTWRYSLFNFNLHTLSHCRCDRSSQTADAVGPTVHDVNQKRNVFRKCLKKSKSPAAHMVGKIYFNVIGSQCFKFTKHRTCKRRNWWGKCKKYGFTKVAHPKKQRRF